MTPAPPTTDANVHIARHGVMRFLGAYTAPTGVPLKRGDAVILKTERGQESGEILCPATPQAVAAIPEPTKGTVLRLATADDRKKMADIAEKQKRQYDVGTELVARHKLAMQIVDVEYLFGGERLLFYFLSEARVDFRELVKSMAREFHTRIELRQIGVRDEARLLADYGDCGRPVCCNTFLAVMPPVGMKMAKLQKATLDPTKISGRCGRLKCCLRYEQDVYELHQQELPPVGAKVLTDKGRGRVLAQELLARRLLVEFEDGRRVPIPAADVLTTL